MAKSFVLITGAAKRLGRSFALSTAALGYDIALHYGKSKTEAEQTADEIRSLGRDVLLIQADLLDESAIKEIIPTIHAQGSLYGLINSASLFHKEDEQSTTYESWSATQMVNVTAPFLLSQAFAHSLKAHESGKIVNIVDWRSLRVDPSHLAYTVSKAALVSLTKNLASALAPRITVNALALGAILSPKDRSHDSSLLEDVPLQRWGEVDEVTQVLSFLLTCATYTTGEVIHIDGGRHLL
ncbi:MAG: SDR family oxidoreductase [Sphaerochaetaceae bacterium]|jgi:NAD(P)-dependent dehydrogenase (short-subunit alcohol dehydrogenase family)